MDASEWIESIEGRLLGDREAPVQTRTCAGCGLKHRIAGAYCLPCQDARDARRRAQEMRESKGVTR